MKYEIRFRTSSKVRYSSASHRQEVDFLGLESFHEALGRCNIVRVALAGHADLKPVIFELVDVIMDCVLHRLVRMMDHPSRGIPAGNDLGPNLQNSLNDAADRWLGDEVLLGRPGEVKGFGHGAEDFEAMIIHIERITAIKVDY